MWSFKMGIQRKGYGPACLNWGKTAGKDNNSCDSVQWVCFCVLRFYELNVWTGIVFLWSLNWKERRETFPRLRYEYLIFESFEIFLMIQPNIVVVCALYIIPVCAKNCRIFNKIHVTSYTRHMLRLKSNTLHYFLCVNQD